MTSPRKGKFKATPPTTPPSRPSYTPPVKSVTTTRPTGATTSKAKAVAASRTAQAKAVRQRVKLANQASHDQPYTPGDVPVRPPTPKRATKGAGGRARLAK